MKYEHIPFKPSKKLVKKRFKKVRSWSVKQFSWYRFVRTSYWLKGLVVAVLAWLGMYGIWAEFSEPLALCTATLVVFLLISRIFED